MSSNKDDKPRTGDGHKGGRKPNDKGNDSVYIPGVTKPPPPKNDQQA